MPAERPATPVAPLPPTDHVARALLKRGARACALDLLRAAVARDPGEKACAALLRAVEARPDAPVYGPDLVLGLDLVRAYARSGMLLEALAVLVGAGLDQAPEGRALGEAIRALFVPPPDDAQEGLREVDAQIRSGAVAVALTMLDELAAAGAPLSPWSAERRVLLSRLLFDEAPVAAAPPAGAGLSPGTPLGRALSAHLARRDLGAALAEAGRFSKQHPADADAAAVVVSLGRLVEGMRAMTRAHPAHVLSTQPMTGHNVALFQLRMGNVSESERMFRKMLLEAPMDDLARQRLDDLQILRRAVEGTGRAFDPSGPTRLDDGAASGVASPVAASSSPPVDPLKMTLAQATGAVLSPGSPDAEGSRGGAAVVVELDASASSPMAEEPTRRVLRHALDARPGAASTGGAPKVDAGRRASGRARAASDDQAEGAPKVDAGRRAELPALDLLAPAVFDVETREVQLSVPSGARRPPTTPKLLQKRDRRAALDGGYGGEWVADVEDWEDEGSTEIGSPEEQAELLLMQGFARQAAGIYERLVHKYPREPRYARRLAEIRDPGAKHAPAPAQAATTAVEDVPPTTRMNVQDVQEAVARAASPPFAPGLPAERASEDPRAAAVAVHRIIKVS